jgi:hypothetical protein
MPPLPESRESKHRDPTLLASPFPACWLLCSNPPGQPRESGFPSSSHPAGRLPSSRVASREFEMKLLLDVTVQSSTHRLPPSPPHGEEPIDASFGQKIHGLRRQAHPRPEDILISPRRWPLLCAGGSQDRRLVHTVPPSTGSPTLPRSTAAKSQRPPAAEMASPGWTMGIWVSESDRIASHAREQAVEAQRMSRGLPARGRYDCSWGLVGDDIDPKWRGAALRPSTPLPSSHSPPLKGEVQWAAGWTGLDCRPGCAIQAGDQNLSIDISNIPLDREAPASPAAQANSANSRSLAHREIQPPARHTGSQTPNEPIPNANTGAEYYTCRQDSSQTALPFASLPAEDAPRCQIYLVFALRKHQAGGLLIYPPGHALYCALHFALWLRCRFGVAARKPRM